MPTILFQNPQAVMLRIPKTGSTSVVRTIFGGIQAEDEVILGPPPNRWMDYYRFGFVRNPFDRLVSALIMFQSYQTETEHERRIKATLTVGSLMDIVLDDSISLSEENYTSKLRMHSIPMSHSFFGLATATDIFRFENYDAEFRRLSAKLGLEVTEVPHFRKSTRSDFRDYYDANERRRAEEIFAEDCDTFGYSFD